MGLSIFPVRAEGSKALSLESESTPNYVKEYRSTERFTAISQFQ